jgi:hypothetical protein
MRKLINLILETSNELLQFKADITARIKELPADASSLSALKEIEDLLKHVNAGGRMGIINGELKSVNDTTVDAARKELARYILSIPQTPEQRDELFSLWRDDKLIDRKKLLSVGKHSFDTMVTNYNTNPLIKELVNELMHIAALGQGKGEFGLSALSKSIHKQEGKGDLSIEGRSIEVKTTDGGAGRFTDQEVRPAAGFENAARKLTTFVTTNPTTPISIPKSGLSLTAAVSYYDMLEGDDKEEYLSLVEDVITIIFGGKKNEKIDAIIAAIKSNNAGAAMQAYSKANFDYYMGQKKDEGVLYINVSAEPITSVFFKEADDLAKSSLRLHAGTAYITSISDVRLPYPQIEIVSTTFGANAMAAQQKVAAKQAKANTAADKKIADIAAGKSSMNLRPQGAEQAADRMRRDVSPAPRQRR